MGMSPWVQRAYFSMPPWAQSGVLSTYGLRLRLLRYGPYHRRVLRDLLHTQWMSETDVRRFQLQRLNAVLKQAATTVPFYRARRLPAHLARLGDLRALPLLEKHDVRTAGDDLLSSVRKGPLVEIHTGGTTGMPLNIRCDRATLQRNYAYFERLLKWAGIPPRPRVATFAGRTFIRPEQSTPPYWRTNLASNALLMSSYHLSPSTIDSYIERLREFKPQLIDSYPSSIEPIARRIVALGITAIRPGAVVTSSETLFPETRALLEQAFGCAVFDYYGAAEMAALITQCERGSYHVNPEFGIVEILRDGEPVGPGETGEIVATGFINPVMPLIRYRTGDLAVPGARGCACGRAFPVLDRIIGRLDDVIVTPDGRRIGRLDPIFKAVASLAETRIIQDAADHLTVEVVVQGEFSAAERHTLVRELANRLGPTMRIDLVDVASIPRAASGKLRTVVNLVSSERQADIALPVA